MPKWIVADSARYYTSQAFMDFLNRSGVGLTVAPAVGHGLEATSSTWEDQRSMDWTSVTGSHGRIHSLVGLRVNAHPSQGESDQADKPT